MKLFWLENMQILPIQRTFLQLRGYILLHVASNFLPKFLKQKEFLVLLAIGIFFAFV